MNIQEIDGSVFKYNPTSKNALKQLQKDYPEFGESHLKAGLGSNSIEYDLEPFRENVLKYVILLYDKNSPLWSTIQDFNHRKITALQMAGFKVQPNGQFSVEVQQGIIMGKNSVVNNMIVRYVFLFNNPKFVMLVGLLQVYINLFTKIQSSSPKKEELLMFKQTAEDIDKLTADIFGGKENQELENTLYEVLNMNKMLFRPEHVAERIANGEEPTNAKPYEQSAS
jgi:hypothetical protein